MHLDSGHLVSILDICCKSLRYNPFSSVPFLLESHSNISVLGYAFADKELSEEIEELHRKELHYSNNNDMSGSPLSSGRDNNSTMRKRRRNVEKEVEFGLGVGGQHEHASPGRSENTLDKENLFSGVFVNAGQVTCAPPSFNFF